jgi:hypothetical protein
VHIFFNNYRIVSSKYLYSVLSCLSLRNGVTGRLSYAIINNYRIVSGKYLYSILSCLSLRNDVTGQL